MSAIEPQSLDLRGRKLRVKWDDDIRTFDIVGSLGTGATASTWRGSSSIGDQYAIKVIPKDYFENHSLHMELVRTRRLSNIFAKIEFYGELQIVGEDPDSLLAHAVDEMYGVVMELVDGITLEDFLKEQINIELGVPDFICFVSSFCQALSDLLADNAKPLCHNDLHARNIMLERIPTAYHEAEELTIRIIDTGSIKTTHRREEMTSKWAQEIETLMPLTEQSSKAAEGVLTTKRRYNWFSRTDHEWFLAHCCEYLTALRRIEYRLPARHRKFLADIVPVLHRMSDEDKTARLDDPKTIQNEIERVWSGAETRAAEKLASPFDWISAELIRNNTSLNNLFSRTCPWMTEFESLGTVYGYGPRGCGKSTILRKISLPAVLADKDTTEFDRIPFIGVYVSCSSELRSRFWLYPSNEFDRMKNEIIEFFTLLLAEALLHTLDHLRESRLREEHPSVHLAASLSRQAELDVYKIFQDEFKLEQPRKLQGVSWLMYAKRQLAVVRQKLWDRVLKCLPREETANPHRIYDVCRQIEERFPLLRSKPIAFLLDDYSNQRIRSELQRVLNQAITFARHPNPIFKITSEYEGVDLSGIAKDREYQEVNMGKLYVNLSDNDREKRWTFLEEVIDKRFVESETGMKAVELLGLSNIKPGMPMARLIKTSHTAFRYYGLDTIADICSGDLAMALDLVKRIYQIGKGLPKAQLPVSADKQHREIHDFSSREHEYIRYQQPYGQEMSEIVDSLAYLAAASCRHATSIKDGQEEPMIRSHVDIKAACLANLGKEKAEIFHELKRKALLFMLEKSRTREGTRIKDIADDTERYQLRRILLVKHIAPLGRRDPIRIDNLQQLMALITEPRDFVKSLLDNSIYGKGAADDQNQGE